MLGQSIKKGARKCPPGWNVSNTRSSINDAQKRNAKSHVKDAHKYKVEWGKTKYIENSFSVPNFVAGEETKKPTKPRKTRQKAFLLALLRRMNPINTSPI